MVPTPMIEKTIRGEMQDGYDEILTPEALAFVTRLHQEFNPRRQELLEARQVRQVAIDFGNMPRFWPETAHIREGDWQVAPPPPDLQDRRVEITGPCDRKMMINALNSGAKVFMADMEDALSPTWHNVIQGQINLRDAVRRTIRFDGDNGKVYELNDETAVLLVRPRGWHLDEKHIWVDDEPISASLFDFGMYCFHNFEATLERGTAPYFYLPKLENHREARLWNDVFVAVQEWLGMPQGTIRATVLIENILAAFEMEEILYELRDHIVGLNAGRWDYIFSAIKTFRNHPEFVLPERSQVTMTVPFMRAYTELMVHTCHKRGAHAIGGMSAFIPNSKEPETTAQAIEKVRADKQREADDGCDGTWVAHPGLIAPVKEVFDAVLGDAPHQKDRLRNDVKTKVADLISLPETGGTVTSNGLRTNISVALRYIDNWLQGNGAVAIDNLMEDAATAEISRAQLWQWIRHNPTMPDGHPVTKEHYKAERDAVLAELQNGQPKAYTNALAILDELVLNDDFTDFLTLIAYETFE